MKKNLICTISIVLIFVQCFCFSACSKKIELTKNNFNEYFYYKIYCGDVTSLVDIKFISTINVYIKPNKKTKCENVTVTGNLVLKKLYSPFASDFPKELTIELDSSGNGDELEIIMRSYNFNNSDLNFLVFEITEVSGSIKA